MAVLELATASSSIKWGDISILTLLIAVIGYLWRQNHTLKKENQNQVVVTIEKSINNLSKTITEATEEFKSALKETRQEFTKVSEDMWLHIGELRENISWLTGQHEVNHKIKYDGPERRTKPRS